MTEGGVSIWDFRFSRKPPLIPPKLLRRFGGRAESKNPDVAVGVFCELKCETSAAWKHCGNPGCIELDVVNPNGFFRVICPEGES